MLLSKILNEMNIKTHYEIVTEKAFNTLGLITAQIEKSFCSFVSNEKFATNISKDVTMIMTTASVYNSKLHSENYGILITDNPKLLFFRIHNYLKNSEEYTNVDFKTRIGKNCKISNNASIASNNVIIGDDCIIEDFAVIKENVLFGNNVIVRSGVIVGKEGYEFKDSGADIFHISHFGSVIIGNNVEIQEITCIDKSIYPWDATTIGNNTKISCRCHIAHGAKIGNNSMITGNCGIGGRAILGDNVYISPSSTIMHGGIIIGDNAFIGIGSVVMNDVAPSKRVTGNPAREIRF